MQRPKEWDEYIGQEALKTILQTAIGSAKRRDATLRPILLMGVPGCGKTTLAEIIANDLGVPLVSHIWPLQEKVLARIVQSHENTVLFLDEIHRGSDKQKEMLLPLLEDHYMEDSRGRKLFSNRLHIVGATTEADKIIKPLWDRFRIRPPFEPYSDLDMARITLRMAYTLGLKEAKFEWASELGAAALGVPRNAQSLVEFALDMQEMTDTMPTAAEVLDAYQVTDSGLTADHVNYVCALAMAGGQGGIDLMKQLLSLPQGYITGLEVDLIKQGLLQRERTGRELTQRGFQAARLWRKDEDG